MPFPRLAEITDTIAHFLSPPDDNYGIVHYSRKDIRNFRLVCKDFAAAGARYLIPTVSIIRTPEIFQIARQIAEHSLLRLSVKALIFYYEKVTVKPGSGKHPGALITAAAQVDQFQASGQDIDSFANLLERFPRLKQIQIRSLAEDTDSWGWQSFATSMNKKLGYDYTLRYDPAAAFRVVHLIETIETLILSNSLHAFRIHSSLPCFGYLKTLRIANPWYGKKAPQWIVPGPLPVIEEFEYIGPHLYRRFFVKNEVINTLPVSLQSLKLQHIECFDKSFPTNLNVLELCDVLFDIDIFPSTLSQVDLSNVRLVGSNMTKWSTVLLSLKANCELTISGCLTICNRRESSDRSGDDPTVAYLHCRDTVINSLDTEGFPFFAGELLMTILQSKSSEGSPRAALLRLLFEECDIHINPGHEDLHRDVGREVSTSTVFETMRQELVEGGWISSEGPLGRPSECYLCYNQPCNYSYTGFVG